MRMSTFQTLKGYGWMGATAFACCILCLADHSGCQQRRRGVPGRKAGQNIPYLISLLKSMSWMNGFFLLVLKLNDLDELSHADF
jgi:hypothetical protein